MSKTLIEKRDFLLQENKRLKTELDNKSHNTKINDIIESINNYSGIRGGKYDDLIFLTDYNTKWKGTFFDVQRIYVEKLEGVYPLNRLETYRKGSSINPFGERNPYEERPGALIGYCDMVAPSSDGPIIRITDPYGSITFPPLKKTPYEVAVNWIGQIITVNALYKYQRKNPRVMKVQVLPFTLKEDLRNIS